MKRRSKVIIERLGTGVPGLDAVLEGGLPEYSFNLIAGEPGAGKTTLAHQILFANASPERPACYFTVLGESSLKMLRYQQQLGFFDAGRLKDGSIRFINLSDVVIESDLNAVLERIVHEVRETSPGLVVVDSFRTVTKVARNRDDDEAELQDFVQRLALHLTSWHATTFLVGEYSDTDMRRNPVFTVADGIIWMSQSIDRDSIVRKLRVIKMRGQPHMPGMHSFRITDQGVQVFPRLLGGAEAMQRPASTRRYSCGVAGLNEMLNGGIPQGDAVLVAGPAGSGKSVLAAQFIAAGIAQREPGLMAVFEEHPMEYRARVEQLGFDPTEMVRQGKLEIIYLRPLDLSLDEVLLEIRAAGKRVGAKRVIIDSLSGFELAVAPGSRGEFRESLYRMVGGLTGLGITVLMTVEIRESFAELGFSPHMISFLSDDIILQRYIELDGEIKRVMAVAKMRRSQHSKELREYQVTPQGLVVGRGLREFRGLLTGVPEPRVAARGGYPGLSNQEIFVLQVLLELREARLTALVQRTGLRRQALTRALEGLLERDYAIQVVEAGRTLYRPVAHSLGGT